MKKDEVMKVLFEEHHRHLTEIKLKINSLTQRVVGFLGLATGWIILGNPNPSCSIKVLLITTYVSISLTSLVALHRFNKNYRAEAKVIRKINSYFKVHKKGYFINAKTLYPNRWKKYGKEPIWYGNIHNLIIILTMAALSSLVTWIH